MRQKVTSLLCPATSLSRATTVPSSSHSLPLHLHYARTSWLLSQIYFKPSLVCRPGDGSERHCLHSDWCPNKMVGEVGGCCIVMSTLPDIDPIWLFWTWQHSAFSPLTAARIREVYHAHMHCQRSRKQSNCHGRNISSPPSPSASIQTCRGAAFVIHQRVRYSRVVYLKNKLAGTKKLPELPSQKPPCFPRWRIGLLDCKRQEANQA